MTTLARPTPKVQFSEISKVTVGLLKVSKVLVVRQPDHTDFVDASYDQSRCGWNQNVRLEMIKVGVVRLPNNADFSRSNPPPTPTFEDPTPHPRRFFKIPPPHPRRFFKIPPPHPRRFFKIQPLTHADLFPTSTPPPNPILEAPPTLPSSNLFDDCGMTLLKAQTIFNHTFLRNSEVTQA